MSDKSEEAATCPINAPAEAPKDPAPAKPVAIADIAGEKDLRLTKSFTVTWRNDDTGHVHTGTFTARRPTIGAIGRISVIHAKLNGGENIDPISNDIHRRMAELQVILTEFPPWWDPESLYVVDPLIEVSSHVRSWLDSFRGRGNG